MGQGSPLAVRPSTVEHPAVPGWAGWGLVCAGGCGHLSLFIHLVVHGREASCILVRAPLLFPDLEGGR